MNVSKEKVTDDFEYVSKILDTPFKNVLALYPVNHFLTNKIASWAKNDDAIVIDPSSIIKEWDMLMLSELIKNHNVTHLFLTTPIYKQLITKSEEDKINGLEAVILSEHSPSQSLVVMHGEKYKSVDLYYLDYKSAISSPINFSKVYDHESGILMQNGPIKSSDIKDPGIYLSDQLKLREIEHVIALHPEVIETIVMLEKEEKTNISFLGTYVQPKFDIQDKQSIEILEKELKRDLKKFLPTHMVPKSWIFINAFNFTQEGQIEKNSLPKHVLNSRQDIYVDKTEIEKKLSNIWCELLQVENVSLEDNFFELGGDSILSIQLVAKARKIGLVMSMDQIFDAQTIKELAQVVSFENVESDQNSKRVLQNQDELFDLSPIQSWFLTQNNENPHHYNQSILLVSEDRLDENIMEHSLQRLVQQFSSLRLRFKQNDSKNWVQYYQSYENTQEYSGGICRVEDLSRLEEEDANVFMQKIINKLHESLNFEVGPLFQACLFQNSVEGDYLFIVAHHLVVDTVSWHILLDDLKTIYMSVVNGKQEEIRLIPEQTSYQKWVQIQQDLLSDGTLNEEVKYWHNALKNDQNFFHKEINNKEMNNTINEMREVNLKLSSNKTQALLQVAPKIYKTQINDLLITALCLTVSEVFGNNTVSFMLEGHGREKLSENIDLSRTIGWFTSNFPINIKLDRRADLKEQINFVKHTLQSVPNKGVGYGILRYLSKDPSNTLKPLKEPELSFNYLGQVDSNLSDDGLFRLSKESTGKELSGKTKRPILFEINCQVFRKQFIVRIEYNQNIHDRIFVKKMAEIYLKKISDIIEPCLSDKNPDYTVSDFPLAKLDQRILETHFFQETNLEDIYPLSPMQEGLLFQKLYRPDSDAYIVQNLFSVNQPIDVNKFKRAWAILLNRHDIFRTGFKWEELPHSLQFVKKSVSCKWEEFDWHNMSTEQGQDKLNNLLVTDRNAGFDYDKPPLVRLYFIYLPQDQHRFIFTFHHLLIDGWCSSILFDELSHIYKRLVENKAPKLFQKKPFKTFIEWVLNNNNEIAKDFFMTYLKNANVTNLSKIVNKQKDITYQHYKEFENHKYAFSEEETKRFSEFARAQKITLSSLFQVAWYKTLQYLSQQDDITFGVVLSGRSAPINGLEDMIGLFINTLPLRIKSDETISVKKLLQDVSEKSHQLQKLSHIPLFEILKWIGQTGKNKLFDTIMVFENHYNNPSSQNPESLGLSLLETYEPTEYPLTLLIAPGERLILDITYKKEFFTLLQIKSITYRLVDVLSLLIQDAETLISSICPVTEQEKSMVLDVWNHTRSEVAVDKLHQIFEKQVNSTPNNIALIEGENQTSFEELNRLSNQIANMLLKEGIRGDQKVAISLPRSKNLIASILAVLKIGAIYVPLDSTYPQERKVYILSDANVEAIISSNISWINLETERTLLQINLDQSDLTCYTSGNLFTTLNTDDDILTYTSSSTGSPKGVMQTHRAHINRFQWMWDSYPFAENDICCQKTSIGFVDAVWETLGPLLKGVPLVILSDEVKHDPIRFIHELNKTKVTRFNTVPSFLNALLEISEKENVKLDHLVICTVSGEACSLETAQRFAKQYPNAKLLNIYGSTEVCADATYYEYKGEKNLTDSLPIGGPINNFNVYIVDRNMNLLSAGIMGEICISGIGVAKGYYNNSSQTKESFIENPFSKNADHKVLFKTGDFGRYLSKGAIEFVGRQDTLVKINGCRVELNEIKLALSDCEFVKDAVVIVKGEAAGEKRIAAFVVVKEKELDQGLLKEKIFSFLKKKIPNYMLPSSVIFLDKIPLNFNGKVDYKKLQSSNFNPRGTVIKMLPSNNIEETLCKIWSEILSNTINDIELSFFEAGGHSILATKLAIRVRQELGYQISIKDVFENSTIKKMAVYLLDKEDSRKKDSMDFKPIDRASRVKINVERMV